MVLFVQQEERKCKITLHPHVYFSHLLNHGLPKQRRTVITAEQHKPNWYFSTKARPSFKFRCLSTVEKNGASEQQLRSVPALGANGAVWLDTLCGNQNHLLESPGKSQHLGTEWHAVTGCSGNSSISHLAAASRNITRAAFSAASQPRRRQGFLAAWRKKTALGYFGLFCFSFPESFITGPGGRDATLSLWIHEGASVEKANRQEWEASFRKILQESCFGERVCLFFV